VFSGVYSVNDSIFDLYIVLISGVVGYVMRLLGIPFLPLVLGLVLGYLVEANYRRALELTGGDHIIFVEDPIALGLLITAALFVVGSAIRDVQSARKAARKKAGGAAA
jgi:putative tricarboxylic transport membrane protein